ncbi:GAF and ANTAR domain-containing protein [Actinomycetospora termitidis]|uniref:GAF and ANTAR domain-containing protein n=1 Tax=Actinomycetospora termitidis TaxID=3053470 RepID=A0ABT7MC17_9PSEU|nr:GAF and ANTAR domain-containing protein [Actinomycetospora sp. Odt1-22]MDL5158199.1 GAF and ANTAR domain-containing protein [Actinomycetospora sp. Odt1-22]
MATEQEWQAARQRFVREAGGGAGVVDGVVDGRVDGRIDAASDQAPGPLQDQFFALARDLFSVPADAGVVGVLERVVRRAHELVPNAAMVSVTLRESDGRYRTPVETDPTATEADHIQYETGEGPCIEATGSSSSGMTSSRDLAHDPRYPRFGPRVARLGMHAVIAAGMFPEGDPPRLGALNFYFRSAEHLADVDQDVLLLLAAHGSVALQAARDVAASRLETAQLTEALRSRDVIGQAKGILMERRGVDADEAFDILRRASQDLNVKIRDVATTIASRRAEL